jgi:hypothetical protein
LVAAFALSQRLGHVRLGRRRRLHGPDDVPTALVEASSQAGRQREDLERVPRLAQLAPHRPHARLVVDQVEQRQEDRPLGTDALVDRRDRRLGLLGDVGHRGGDVPAFGEEPSGRGEDVAARSLGLDLAAIFSWLAHSIDNLL